VKRYGSILWLFSARREPIFTYEGSTTEKVEESSIIGYTLFIGFCNTPRTEDEKLASLKRSPYLAHRKRPWKNYEWQ
jgi:hypothetical protein